MFPRVMHITLPISVPSSTVPHITHLLRLRVLQELELLTARLRWQNRWQPHDPSSSPTPVLRRLTRAEFQHVRETGYIPFSGAVAVIVVPPVNRDSKTKERPRPHNSALPEPPLVTDKDASLPKRPLPSASVLLPACPTSLHGQDDDVEDLPDVISTPKVPLYNGVPLFPTKPTRAALHKLLCELLAVDARARYYRPRATKRDDEAGKSEKVKVKGDQKASHAFLLCSSAETLARADAVPLAVALWRLRVWSGEPWTGENGTWASIV